jgi:hypothetical protein
MALNLFMTSVDADEVHPRRGGGSLHAGCAAAHNAAMVCAAL